MQVYLITAISILSLLFSRFEAQTQEMKTVSGIVTVFRQYPLNKVRIVATKSRAVIYTDSMGRFSIQCYEKDILTAAASGFGAKRTRIGKQNVYLIDLFFKDDVTSFNDAVTGGHISENVLREAIRTSQLKKLKDYSIYTTIYELIDNEIYSVTVNGTSVYNKKIRSFDLTPQVLYVVDNKIVSDISFVAPNNVKTIEFIDDVGTTMYGVSGANGVIKITQK